MVAQLIYIRTSLLTILFICKRLLVFLCALHLQFANDFSAQDHYAQVLQYLRCFRFLEILQKENHLCRKPVLIFTGQPALT
jgi:hypothetical protein